LQTIPKEGESCKLEVGTQNSNDLF